MPYNTKTELPDAVRKLPSHAQDIWMAAFNNSYKGDEGQAAAIAWSAVKNKYKKNPEGQWVAKESVMVVKETMSDVDKRALLQSSITSSLAIGHTSKPVIQDVYDDELVYEVSGKMYRMSYVIDRKGKVVFGEAEKVIPQKEYTAVQESINAGITELAEAAADKEETYNFEEITEKLMVMVENEKVTKAEAKPVLEEAQQLIKKLSEAAMTKTEDGRSYPASAFAYVPDPQKPSSWKLRLWESPDAKVTRAQLGRAAAALSPGGFRGQKVQIPESDLSGVKRKIRSSYRTLGVDDEDIPRWVKESESRELMTGYVSLAEAKIDGRGIAELDIIRPGFNADNSRYYPPDVLSRDYGIFEGVKMYTDHPSNDDEKNRPERSIRDWAATLNNVHVDESGKLRGKATIVEPWFKEKLNMLRDQGLLETMGVSINAIGTAVKGKIEGKTTMIVEKLVRARSVDFVTEAGAGGMVTMYEAIADVDIDLMDVDGLRERRPDLVTELESNIRNQVTTEVKARMEIEERVKELEGQVESLTTERDDAVNKLSEVEKAKAKAEAQAIITEALGKAELPEKAKERLSERFKEAETADGIQEAIQSEAEYVAALTEKGKVKDLGLTHEEPEGKSKEKLEEAFTELLGSPEAGKIAARGR